MMKSESDNVSISRNDVNFINDFVLLLVEWIISSINFGIVTVETYHCNVKIQVNKYNILIVYRYIIAKQCILTAGLGSKIRASF